MSYEKSLRCKECGAEHELTARSYCEECLGPVEVTYDYDAIKRVVSRGQIARSEHNLWRYRHFLPIKSKPSVGLRSGWTPLIKADRLAAELGVTELYIKDDSSNRPTYSYKDRVVSVALTRAVEFGFDVVGCASTGNLAHSVAAHAAAAGLDSVVLIPHDLEAGKVVGTSVFGPQVVKVKGNYDDVNRLCSEIADRYNWALVNVNLRPYYTEGAKTVGFEIAEQLGWKLPAHTVIPAAGGTILPKIYKAYDELVKTGLVADGKRAVYAAQAAGCDPLAKALREDSDGFFPQKPNTIAKSIAIGNPADGHYVLDCVRKSGGAGESASDAEIIDAIKLLARTEGVFTEPAGGTTLACAIKLIQSGTIPKDEPIVVCITGNGLKTIECLDGQFQAPVIDAKLSAFSAYYDNPARDIAPAAAACKPAATTPAAARKRTRPAQAQGFGAEVSASA